MATVSRTPDRPDSKRPLLQGQQVTLARAGSEAGVVRLVLEPVVNAAAAQAALERWRARSAQIKPNSRNGGAAAIRRLRDGR